MKRFRPSGYFETVSAQVEELENFCDRDMVAEIAPIDGSHWRLCLHPLNFKRNRNPNLSALLDNPAAKNPLFHPAFVNAGRDRVTQGKIFQMVVWEMIEKDPIPRMMIPVIERAGNLWRQPALQSLTHPYAPLGAPLMLSNENTSEESADEIVERFFELAAAAFEEGMSTLLFDHLPADTPLIKLLSERENKGPLPGLCVSTQPIGSRAVIAKSNSDPLGRINKKRMREYRRLEKKLAQTGTVTYEITDNSLEVLVRLEEFLLLEARSWKGRQGTSIHNLKRHAAFARQAIYDLSQLSQAEIATLRVNDVAIASTLVISQNGQYFPWKTAFNETLSSFSPGTLLMVWLTRELAQRDDFAGADSLAKFGNSWMTALWSDKREFFRAVIAADCGEAASLQNDLSKSDRLKATIKKALGRK